MKFPAGLKRRFLGPLPRTRRAAYLLVLAVLLMLVVSGCDILSTPESPQPTDTPQLPTATPFPATLTPTPEPQTPSAEGLVLAVTVASANANRPDYDRSEWRHWIDEDRDCQNARQEVLIEESSTPAVLDPDNECRVLSGSWVGPYTGQAVNDPTELDIDHMVPLENAHRSGAWSWDRDRKREYANYLAYEDHLIATTSRANRSKGSKGPEEWRPPLESYWCEYALDWIAIKNSWDLTVSEREFAALRAMLDTCPMPVFLQRSEAAQSGGSANVPASPEKDIEPTPTPPPAPTPAPTATPPPGLRYDPYGPDRDCGDFESYEEALDFFLAAGGPDKDPHLLDSDGDGEPCASLPRSRSHRRWREDPVVQSAIVLTGFTGVEVQPSPTIHPTRIPAPLTMPEPTTASALQPAPTPTVQPMTTPAPEPIPDATPEPQSLVAPTPTPQLAPGPSPTAPLGAGSYVGLPYDPQGPDRSCGDFDTWWVAQNFYHAAGGPDSDPHRLDGNGDGIVCESLRDVVTDDAGQVVLEPDDGFFDWDCVDFVTWREAQTFFLMEGGPADDPHRLDTNGDGVACESLVESPLDGIANAGDTIRTSTEQEDAFVDRNCGDFISWQHAQDFFLAEGGPDDDPHRIDGNGNGVACESLPDAPE